MRKYWWWIPILGLLLAFWVWFRRPAGPSTGNAGLTEFPSLADFDREHPNAPFEARKTFWDAVRAHADGDVAKAQELLAKALGLCQNK